ncbi:MAG TPA: YihY/virulence factor BrkB family protein [Chloroflexota bacterium]
MNIKEIFKKISKDNIGVLASIVSWSVLTSLVPIVVGLLAISGLALRGNSGAQRSVVSHLSSALQGVLSPTELTNLVAASTQHAGLLGIIGFVGILWGGSSVGGAISTVFQAIFEVKGRNFIIEKLIDVGMIFVFTILMIVIVVGTTAGSLVKSLFSGFPFPGVATFAIGTAISIVAAFLLFFCIYVVFPNVETRFRFQNVWKGALLAAVLFDILTYIFPLYVSFAHFKSHGALLGAFAVLMAWIYFFSITMILGAEVVAIGAIQQANAEGESVGPEPENNVPQHAVLRDGSKTA